jgi:release factor glutamine methyltransferase
MAASCTVSAAIAQSGLVPLDAQVLLAHALQRDRAWLAAHCKDPLSRDQADVFFALAKRRRDGEPVAYLTGAREFWGLPLEVTRAVLIPRPETETLVEVALERLPDDRALRILDLGTGSGAVAVAIARERPLARVVAVDIDEPALAVARSNAQRLHLQNVEFLHSDWFASLPPDARFEAIVSNPPYVASADPHLADGDVRFEPRAALVSGSDGLAALRTIVAGAPSRLVGGGVLAVEHGYDQAERVRRLFEQAGFGDLRCARDLAGIARVASGRLV